jgi:hypothetical protein
VKVTVLGTAFLETPQQPLQSLIIDDALAIDAGAWFRCLDAKQRSKIKAVVLTEASPQAMRDLLMWLVERDGVKTPRLALVAASKTLAEARRAYGKAFELLEVGPEGRVVGKHHVAVHAGGVVVRRSKASLALGTPTFLATQAESASLCIVDAHWPVSAKARTTAQPVAKEWLWTRADGTAPNKLNRARAGDVFELR